jgi:uncharacterized Fe-S cluster protein YjdI
MIPCSEKYCGIKQTILSYNYHFKRSRTYISKQAGKDFSKIFEQYLRTTQIPELIIKGNKNSISYHWENCIKGFDMPVRLNNGQWICPSEKTKSVKLTSGDFDSILPDIIFISGCKKSNDNSNVVIPIFRL